MYGDPTTFEMLELSLHFPKQLTYPIERWSVPRRLDNEDERERFFDAVLTQGSLVAACQKMGMARGSVRRYRDNNPEFESRLQSVFEDLYHDLGFQAIKLADDARADGRPEMSSLVRNQIDARLRVRGYHKPNLEVNVDNRTQTVVFNDPEREKLIEMRKKALENKKDESNDNN